MNIGISEINLYKCITLEEKISDDVKPKHMRFSICFVFFSFIYTSIGENLARTPKFFEYCLPEEENHYCGYVCSNMHICSLDFLGAR